MSAKSRITFATPSLSDRRRFWAKVHVVADANSCWEWQASVHKFGHGQFSYCGKPITAHRFAYLLVHKALAPVIRHTCDNPRCIRPAHLLGGTHQDNVQDRVNRGRTRTGHVLGEAHANAKLTEAQVRYIKASDKTGPQLALELGVDHTVVYGIRNGKRWKWVA